MTIEQRARELLGDVIGYDLRRSLDTDSMTVTIDDALTAISAALSARASAGENLSLVVARMLTFENSEYVPNIMFDQLRVALKQFTASPQPAQAGASGGGEIASVVLRLRRILADSEAGRISGLGDTCEDAINSAIEHIEASESRARAFCRKHGLDPDSPVDVAGIGVTLPRWKAWEADAERDALSRAHEAKYATAERLAKPAATTKCYFCGARPGDLHAFDCAALDTTPASPATGKDG